MAIQVRALRYDDERRLVDQINNTLNSFSGSAAQVAGSVQTTGNDIAAAAVGATNLFQTTGDAIRGTAVGATNALQETSGAIGRVASCASTALKIVSWGAVAVNAAAAAVGALIQYKVAHRAVSVVELKAGEAIATANRTVTLADQRTGEAIATADRTANRAVAVMEQKADRLIETADAQCAAARQDAREVAMKGLDVVRDETKAAIEVVREGIQSGLKITQKTAAIACAILACASAGFAAQGEDSSIRIVGTTTSVMGLLGIGSYCFRVWAKEAAGTGTPESVTPWTRGDKDAVLGLIKTNAVLGESTFTAGEIKLLQGNPAAHGLAMAKAVLHEADWSEDELRRVGIKDNGVDGSHIELAHPGQEMPALPNNNTGETKMVSRVNTMIVPLESFERLAQAVQRLEADNAKLRTESAAKDARMDRQDAEGRRRDEEVRRLTEEGLRRDEEIRRLNARTDGDRALMQGTLERMEEDLNSTRRICQITCAVGGAVVGLAGGFVVGATIGVATTAAGVVAVADSVLGVGACATAVAGGIVGEETGRKHVGPQLHERVCRKSIEDRNQLRLRLQ